MQGLQDGLGGALLAVALVLARHGGGVLAHRHGELVALALVPGRVALVAYLQVVQAEVPLEAGEQNVVGGGLRGFGAEFRHPGILDPYLVEEG